MAGVFLQVLDFSNDGAYFERRAEVLSGRPVPNWLPGLVPAEGAEVEDSNIQGGNVLNPEPLAGCEVSSVTDPLIFTAYPDEFGRVKKISQHAGSTREFSYDSMGRPQGEHAITSFGGTRIPYTVNQKWGQNGQHAGVDIKGPLSVSASGLGSQFHSLTVDGEEVMNAYGPTCLEPGKC